MHSTRIDIGNEIAVCKRSMKGQVLSALATETKINMYVRPWLVGWICFTVVSYLLSLQTSQYHVVYLKYAQ